MTGQVVLVVWLISALLGALIGNSKGRGGTGFILGLLLGLIGLIIIALMKPADKPMGAGSRQCPWCSEVIQRDALVCKHCGRDAARLPDPERSGEAWLTDPSKRHPERWWDGANWTKWVRDKPGGTRSEDPAMP